MQQIIIVVKNIMNHSKNMKFISKANLNSYQLDLIVLLKKLILGLKNVKIITKLSIMTIIFLNKMFSALLYSNIS